MAYTASINTKELCIIIW